MILEARSGRAGSRRELANELRLSPTTAGQYVDQLISLNFLEETGLDQGALGRPKRKLSVRADAGWFAGVEFNAERVQAVRVDFSGAQAVTQVQVLPEGANAEYVLGVLPKLVERLAEGAVGRLQGIGMGVPGVVDVARGLGLDYAFLPGWRDVPLAGPLAERFEVPVVIDNNMRVIALAERWFGGGRNLDNYVILGPRSGFGVAVVSEGRVLRGARAAAGEAGRWPWPGAGGEKRVHDELSALVVWRRLAGAAPEARVPGDLRAALADLAETDGGGRAQVVAEFAHFIGCLQLLLDTTTYFLHGPLTALGQRFCGDILDEMARRFPELQGALPMLVGSALGDDAGALGAASLAMEQWLPKD